MAYGEGDCVRSHPIGTANFPITTVYDAVIYLFLIIFFYILFHFLLIFLFLFLFLFFAYVLQDMRCGWLPYAAQPTNRKCPVARMFF